MSELSEKAEFLAALAEDIDIIARRAARDEIASLAGLMLRRLQDMGPTRSPDRNMAVEILSELFGEVLKDFGDTDSEPGG
jgi:hypothetical protein